MNILSYKKPAFWIVIAVLALVAALCVALIANPRVPQEPSDGSTAPAPSASESSASSAPESSASESSAPEPSESESTEPSASGSSEPAPAPLSETAFLSAFLRGVSVDGSLVRVVIPDSIPEGYILSVSAAALIPDGEASHMSVELFADPEASRGWTAGETYAESFLTGEIPDETTVSVTVYLSSRRMAAISRRIGIW